MSTGRNGTPVAFQGRGRREVTARFDGRRLSRDGERPVHRPEARTASVAQRGDEVSVAVHGGAERPGAHAVPGAPGLDRPQKPGIEDAAGI